MSQLTSIAVALLLAGSHVLAKTDMEDCTYVEGTFTPSTGDPWATRTFYLPDTGEICEILDCGGGLSPPKTTVPGCPEYGGTLTYAPRFLVLATETDSDGQPTTVVASVTGGSSHSITSVPDAVVTSIFDSMSTSTIDADAGDEGNAADRTWTETEVTETPQTGGGCAAPTAVMAPYIAAGFAVVGVW